MRCRKNDWFENIIACAADHLYYRSELFKNLLVSVVIYMAFSLVMSIIWLILESPDLAITEAAVGAGVTSILFFVTLKKIRSIRTTAEEDIDE